ncbi:MAG: hypothetical protein FWE23_02630 [Chitinivibrionia bacterium]|nr:hypothetical protein [Chitinivibrionia bacterium]
MKFHKGRKEALSNYFFNISALAFVGSVITVAVDGDGSIFNIGWGLALTAALLIIGFILKGTE